MLLQLRSLNIIRYYVGIKRLQNIHFEKMRKNSTGNERGLLLNLHLLVPVHFSPNPFYFISSQCKKKLKVTVTIVLYQHIDRDLDKPTQIDQTETHCKIYIFHLI